MKISRQITPRHLFKLLVLLGTYSIMCPISTLANLPKNSSLLIQQGGKLREKFVQKQKQGITQLALLYIPLHPYSVKSISPSKVAKIVPNSGSIK